jgi:hypothetical protein
MHFRTAVGLTLGWIVGCSEGADPRQTEMERPAATRPDASLQGAPAPMTESDGAAQPAEAGAHDARTPTLDSAANRSDATSSDATSSDATSSDATSSDGASVDASAGESSEGCLRAPSDYARPGSFGFSLMELERVKVWVPEVAAGCRVPLVHFSNGTGATCDSYGDVLRLLASHGFLTVCAESTNTAAGTQCVDALTAARDRFPALAGSAIGSAGHHTGGAGALLCLNPAQARFGAGTRAAGFAVAPASGTGGSPDWMARFAEVHAPLLMMRGTNDVLVSKMWVRSAFDLLPDRTESYWFEAVGANHVPLPTRWMQESIVAWFRWKLLDDRAACSYLKALPAQDHWELEAEQAPSDC